MVVRIDFFGFQHIMLQTATHTKTGNNTRSLGTRTNNTTTHIKTGNNTRSLGTITNNTTTHTKTGNSI